MWTDLHTVREEQGRLGVMVDKKRNNARKEKGESLNIEVREGGGRHPSGKDT